MVAFVTDFIVLQARYSARTPLTVTCLKDFDYSTIYPKHALYLYLHCHWPSCLSYRCSSPVYGLYVILWDLVCHADETRFCRETRIRDNDVVDYFYTDDSQKRDYDEPDYFYTGDN